MTCADRVSRRGDLAREGSRDLGLEMSWPLRGFVGRTRNAELLEPAAEGVGMEAQDLGRAAGPVDDPMRLAEDGDDMAALDRFEGGDRGISCRDGGAGGRLGVDLEVEGGAGREDDGALEHVLQLADIPGPSIGDEATQGLRAHAVEPPAGAGSELVDQEADQERDVLGAFSERGKRDGEDAEAIVEIL